MANQPWAESKKHQKKHADEIIFQQQQTKKASPTPHEPQTKIQFSTLYALVLAADRKRDV
jgi:hypothetical protein